MGWYLRQPDGNEIDLNVPPYVALVGKQGFVFPNVAYSSTRSPFGGEVVSDHWKRGRKLLLPLRVTAEGQGTYRGAVARLARAVSSDPSNPSWLIWRSSVGARRIPVLLDAGTAWTDTPENAGRGWTKVALSLYSPAAYWEAEDEVEVSVVGVESSAFLPNFPFQLTASGVVGQVLIDVNGYGAYVRWVIRGSASHVLLQNNTTGDMMYFPDLMLADGDNLVITASPSAIVSRVAIAIYYADGRVEDGWRYLSSGSKVWFLGAGSNDVSAQAIDTTDVTLFTLYYRPFYLSPWSDAE